MDCPPQHDGPNHLGLWLISQQEELAETGRAPTTLTVAWRNTAGGQVVIRSAVQGLLDHSALLRTAVR